MSNKYDWLLKKTPRSVKAIRLWGRNPRLDPEGDYYTLNDFANEVTVTDAERKEFIALAKSITEKGFIPADPVVLWQNEDNGKYYVAEGNRRILAIKLLLDPKLAPKSIKSIFTSLSKKVNSNALQKIHVSIAPTFEDAEWYISQRNSMSSLQRRWTSEQQRRWVIALYEKYNGDITRIREKIDLTEAELQNIFRILELKSLVREISQDLTPEEFERASSIRFPITTLERFFNASTVRQRWGIEFDGFDVRFINKLSFLRAYASLIKRILLPEGSSERIDSRSLGTREILEKVLDSLPPVSLDSVSTDVALNTLPIGEREPANLTLPDSKDDKAQSDQANEAASIPQIVAHDNPNRNKLVPNAYIIESNYFRLNAIFEELKKVPYQYPNAIAASLRILLDLSILNYIQENGFEQDIKVKFGKDLRDITLKNRLEFIKEKIKDKKSKATITKLLNPSNEFSLDVLNGFQHSSEHHYIDKKFLNRFFNALFPILKKLVTININP